MLTETIQVGNPGNHIKVGVTVWTIRAPSADRERRYEAVVDASNRFATARRAAR